MVKYVINAQMNTGYTLAGLIHLFLEPPGASRLLPSEVWNHRDIEHAYQAIGLVLLDNSVAPFFPRHPIVNAKPS